MWEQNRDSSTQGRRARPVHWCIQHGAFDALARSATDPRELGGRCCAVHSLSLPEPCVAPPRGAREGGRRVVARRVEGGPESCL